MSNDIIDSLTYRLTAQSTLNSFLNGFGKLYAKPVDVSLNTPPSSFHTNGLSDAPKVMEELLKSNQRNKSRENLCAIVKVLST